MARIERNNKKGILFENLSKESIHQANIWKDLAKSEGTHWEYRPDLKIKIMAILLNKIGPKYFVDVLSAMKIRGISLYRLGETHDQLQAGPENIHSKIKSGSNLRAAIFGVNDGLVSNASLVFAMVGASSESKTIILTGVAGLLAGGFSMATGEYISVKSQRELFENQIDIEREELEEFPEEEAKELALIYQAKGIDQATATHIATTLVQDKEKALDTLAREELGLNPNELGSAMGAATSSFISFSLGAILPLLPFLIFSKNTAITSSFFLCLAALFLVGVIISFLTGKSLFKSGIRMCFLGLLSGVSTYYIGHLIGVSLN